MRYLIQTAFFLLLSNSFLSAQVVTPITGFDVTVSSDKELYDIQKLDDTTALIFFHRQKTLWRTDGTKDGTYLIHNWSSESSIKNEFPCYTVGIVNGKAIMLVTTDAEGRELWVSDGTNAGTHILVDYIQGKYGLDDNESRTKKFATVDNNCYLLIKDNNKWHIMKTDGTVAGTEIFAENIVDNGFSNIDAPNLFFVGNDFYFMFFNKFFRINKDTKAVTVFPCQSYSGMSDIRILNDSTLLLAIDKSNGVIGAYNTNTITLLELGNSYFDFKYDEGGYYHEIFTYFNNKYFYTIGNLYDYHMYATDGTLAGTKLIRDVPMFSSAFIEFDEKLWYDNQENNNGINSIDKNDVVKTEIPSYYTISEKRGFGLLDNDKFFLSAPFTETDNDWEPHIYDPSNKTLTKIANLNSSDSYPKFLTKLREYTYLFYANDDVNKGSLYSLKVFPTAINEVEKKIHLKAIPNITEHSWTISYSDFHAAVSYYLSDVKGNIVKTGKLDKESFKIDASDLFPGAYFLSAGIDGYNECVKLVKQ